MDTVIREFVRRNWLNPGMQILEASLTLYYN